MAKCNWEPFFTEFTDKILEYKDVDKRPELLKMVGTAFSQAKYALPKCGSDNNGKELTLADNIQNLDPFSILMFIVRGGTMIKNICPKIEQVFGLKNHFPPDFDGIGIPVPKAVNKQFCLTWYFETPQDGNNTAIDYLWNLFEATINLRNNYSEANKTTFIYLYNNFLNEIKKGWQVSSVTDLLFLVAPSRLIGLNGKCVPYIYYLFHLSNNKNTKIACSTFDGEKYLSLCECLKTKLAENRETFLDLYYDCYSSELKQNLQDVTLNFLRSKGYKNLSKRNSSYAGVQIQKNHKGQYCIWPNKNLKQLNNTWYWILNDWVNNSTYLVEIPPNTIKAEQLFVGSEGKTKGVYKLELKLYNGDFIDLLTKKSDNPIKIGMAFYHKYDYTVSGKNKVYVDASSENDNVLTDFGESKNRAQTTLSLFVADSSDISKSEDSGDSNTSVEDDKTAAYTSKDEKEKEKTGKSGEKVVYEYLVSTLDFLGHKITGGINNYCYGKKRNDKKGYDFSFEIDDGQMIYIDVKSSLTKYNKKVDFFLSSHEYLTMAKLEKQHPNSYYICFVDNIENIDIEPMKIRAIKASDIVDNKIPITYRLGLKELNRLDSNEQKNKL